MEKLSIPLENKNFIIMTQTLRKIYQDWILLDGSRFEMILFKNMG
jgi:hypothetical protein